MSQETIFYALLVLAALLSSAGHVLLRADRAAFPDTEEGE